MSNITAIKTYFENVTNDEIRSLTKEDRQELGDLIRAELGVQSLEAAL